MAGPAYGYINLGVICFSSRARLSIILFSHFCASEFIFIYFVSNDDTGMHRREVWVFFFFFRFVLAMLLFIALSLKNVFRSFHRFPGEKRLRAV